MAEEQKYTRKVIEAINAGIAITKDRHLPSFDVPELLRALFDQEDSFYVNILKKLDIDPKIVSQTIDSFIQTTAKTTSSGEPDSSADVKNILYTATKFEKEMQDEYRSKKRFSVFPQPASIR